MLKEQIIYLLREKSCCRLLPSLLLQLSMARAQCLSMGSRGGKPRGLRGKSDSVLRAFSPSQTATGWRVLIYEECVQTWFRERGGRVDIHVSASSDRPDVAAVTSWRRTATQEFRSNSSEHRHSPTFPLRPSNYKTRGTCSNRHSNSYDILYV